MITAEKLQLLTNFPADILTLGIQKSGYKKDSFLTARFIGITNGGQFCYNAVYKTEDGDMASCHVYVTYDHAADQVIVDY
jgi:hypothetical protein